MSIAHQTIPRSGAATTKANSWAVVCLWRRFFQLKEEEGQEQLEVLSEVLEESTKSPVSSNEAKQVRREILQDHYRTITTAPKVTITYNEKASQATPSGPDLNVMREHNSQVLREPNLDIPTQNGYGYVNLAQ